MSTRNHPSMSARTREYLARQDALGCPPEMQTTPDAAPQVIAALEHAKYFLELHAVSGSIYDFDMRTVMHCEIQWAKAALDGDDHAVS